MIAAGKIGHRYIFFTEDGKPFTSISLPYSRWRDVLDAVAVRYRKPYASRHSYTNWRLMMGDDRNAVARDAGYDFLTMAKTYAAW